jgi:hypothetical protein
MSRALSEDELEAAVRKLKYGRAVGPDGLRGELLKGLYTRELFWLEDKQMWVEKHVYDTTPGSVLGDLLELLNAAFSASAVPKEWCSTHLSAIFKKGDPSVLDNYRGIAVGTVLGKVFSLILHARCQARLWRLPDWLSSMCEVKLLD